MKLAKTDFTILASNCNGSFMYHDMGLPYLTPMVNLSMRMDDFVTMLENLRWYMNQDIVEIKENRKYPSGLLGGDITINFVHYNTFKEGVEK